MSLEPTQHTQDFDEQPINVQYRVRYYFGELELTSEWNSESALVENFAEQLRRERAANITIEKRPECPVQAASNVESGLTRTDSTMALINP